MIDPNMRAALLSELDLMYAVNNGKALAQVDMLKLREEMKTSHKNVCDIVSLTLSTVMTVDQDTKAKLSGVARRVDNVEDDAAVTKVRLDSHVEETDKRVSEVSSKVADLRTETGFHQEMTDAMFFDVMLHVKDLEHALKIGGGCLDNRIRHLEAIAAQANGFAERVNALETGLGERVNALETGLAKLLRALDSLAVANMSAQAGPVALRRES